MFVAVRGTRLSGQVGCEGRPEDARRSAGKRKTRSTTPVPRRAQERQEAQRAGKRDVWKGKSDFWDGASTVMRKSVGMATVFAGAVQVAAPAEAGTSFDHGDAFSTMDCIHGIWRLPVLTLALLENAAGGFAKEIPERLLIAVSFMATAYVGYMLSSKLSDNKGNSDKKSKPLDPEEFEKAQFRQGWKPSDEQMKKSPYLRAEHELRMREVEARNKDREERLKKEEDSKNAE